MRIGVTLSAGIQSGIARISWANWHRPRTAGSPSKVLTVVKIRHALCLKYGGGMSPEQVRVFVQSQRVRKLVWLNSILRGKLLEWFVLNNLSAVSGPSGIG